MTASKLTARTRCQGIQIRILVETFAVSLRSRNFRFSVILWLFISYEILSLNSENFKLVSQRKVNSFFVRNIIKGGGGKGVGSVVLESEGLDVQMGLNFWVAE